MKKKTVLLTLICAVVLTLTSCMSSRRLDSYSQDRTQVVLSTNNFRIVGTAEGSTTGVYICGFDALSNEALRNNAIAEMYKNANLKGSQTIINVNITTSVRSIAGVYTRKFVTARGQIIEFR